MPMSIQNIIEEKLNTALAPTHLEVLNESHRHNVPEGSESHFKVTIVSQQFGGKMPVARHRIVNRLLAAELAGDVHALAMHTYTPQEWSDKNAQAPASPPCLGGAKQQHNR